MQFVTGIAIVVLTLPCWLGQALSWLAPATAERWGLTEARDEVDPLYHADAVGEAAWDAFTLWTMPLAGLLLALDVDAWAVFGLAGGGAYLYFAGRGIATRLVMRRGGHRIGTEQNVRTAFVALTVWGTLAALTVALAAAGYGT